MEHTMQNLRDLMMRELDEIINRGEMDENSLACAYKIVDIIKDIAEIEEKEQGYSGDGYPMYPYAMEGNSYNSYRGYSNRGRDRMGRFTSNGMSRRGYSRGSEREEIMAKMGHMMDTAASETERQAIQRIMNQL